MSAQNKKQSSPVLSSRVLNIVRRAVTRALISSVGRAATPSFAAYDRKRATDLIPSRREIRRRYARHRAIDLDVDKLVAQCEALQQAQDDNYRRRVDNDERAAIHRARHDPRVKRSSPPLRASFDEDLFALADKIPQSVRVGRVNPPRRFACRYHTRAGLYVPHRREFYVPEPIARSTIAMTHPPHPTKYRDVLRHVYRYRLREMRARRLNLPPPQIGSTIEAQGLGDVFVAISRALPPMGTAHPIALGATATLASVAIGMAAIPYVYNKVRWIPDAVSPSKGSDLLQWMSPQTAAYFRDRGFNPVYLAAWIYDVLYALTTGNDTLMVSIALQASEIFSIAATVIMAVLYALLRYIRHRYIDVKPHAADSESEGNVLTALVDVVASTFKVTNRADLAKLSKDVSDISRGSETATKFLAGVLHYSPSWIRTSIGRMLPAHGWAFAIEDLNPEQFMADARVMLTEANISLSYTNTDISDRLNNLYDIRCEIAKRLVGFKVDPTFAREFTSLARELDLWKKKHFTKSTKVRPVPFNLTLFGDPAVGKTFATALIAQRLGLSTWTHKSSHWDGYAGQPIVVYDDWCATSVDEEFVREWLTIHSNVAFFPDFASLNDPTVGVKGTPFSSHYIFCSTNSPYPAPNTVIDRVAFLRRRNMLVKIELEDGTRTFQIYNSLQNEAISGKLTFEEFYAEFLARANQHFREQRNVVAQIGRPLADGDDPFRQIFNEPPLDPVIAHAEPLIMIEPPPVVPDPAPLPWYRRLANWWITPNDYISRFIHNYPWVIPTLAALGVAYVIYKMMFQKVKPHSAYEAGETPKAGRVIRKSPVAAQGDLDSDDDLPTNLGTIRSCQVKILLSAMINNKPWRMRGYAIGTSSMLLMPSHFLAPLRVGAIDSLYLEFTRSFKSGTTVTRSIQITMDDVRYMVENGGECDISTVDIGTSSCFPNIIKYFRDDLANSADALLIGDEERPDKKVHVYLEISGVEYEYNGIQIVADTMYRYDEGCRIGDCGRMLLTYDGVNTYRILGMHTAGNSSIGYSIPIVRDDIRDLSVGIVMPPVHPVPIIDPPIVAQGDDVPFPGQLTLLDSNVMRLHAPSKHAHRPSVIAKFLPPSVKDNSILAANDPRAPGLPHPMHINIEKISKPGDNYDLVVLDRAYDLLVKLFPLPRKPRVLSLTEAIYGQDGWIRSLNFASSAGFPYNLKKKKRDLFFDSVGNPRIENCVLQTCDFREHYAAKGVRIPSAWTSVLKDELRMQSKIEQGLTRSICAAPVDYTIVFRRYFQDCIQLIEENRHDSPSIVGIDINSIEFDALIKRVNTHPNIYATDYRNNDGSFPVPIMERVLRFFNEAYDDQFSMIRTVLYHEAMYTYHYWDHYVFLDHGSENSGFAGTTINNTLGDLLEDIYCILMQAPEDVVVDIDYLKKNFVLVRYGDDSLTSYSHLVSSWFSPQKHIAQVNVNGREMTSEDKLSETTLKAITDVTILKQRPGHNPDFPGRFVPLMDKTLIEDIPKWIRRGGDAYINTVVNCEAALRFAFWHGRLYYEHLRSNLEDALSKVTPHHFLSYDVLLRARRLEYYGYNREYANLNMVDLNDDLRNIFGMASNFTLTDTSLSWLSTADRSYLVHLRVYNTTVERILEESSKILHDYHDQGGLQLISEMTPQVFFVRRSRLGVLPRSVIPAYLPRCDLWALIYDPQMSFAEIGDEMTYEAQGQSYILPRESKIKVEGPTYAEYPSLVLDSIACDIPQCYARLNHLQCCWYSTASVGQTITRVAIDSDMKVVAQGDDSEDELVQLPSSSNQSLKTADTQWDLNKFFGREYPVTTVPWNLNATGLVVGLNIPFALVTTAQQRTALYAFHHIRFDVEIRVVVTGTRFHQGLLCATFDYGSNTNPSFTLPHAMMNANGVSEAVLRLPFIWTKGFLSVDPKEHYCVFEVIALSPLLATEGSTKSVPVSVYARFTNIKTQIPLIRPIVYAQGNSSSVFNMTRIEGEGNTVSSRDEVDLRNDISPKLAVSAGQKAGDVSTEDSTPPPIPNPRKVTDGSETPDRVTRTVAPKTLPTAGKAKPQPALGGSRASSLSQPSAVVRTFTPVLAPTVDAGGEGGLDLVGNHIDPPYFQPVKMGNYYNVENIEPVFVARMYPNQLTKTTVHDSGHDYDEMLISNLVIIPEQIATISFTTQPFQTMLAAYNVEPTFYPYIDISKRYAPVPWCQAIASLSAFWSGDMIFTFQVISSGYQTGKLLVSVVYGPDQPTNYTEAINGHTVEIDVSNPHLKHSIRIPFIDNVSMLPVSRGPKDTRRSWTARLYVYVQAPLSTPSGAPPRVDLIVHAAGAQNLQFVGRAAEVPYIYSGPSVKEKATMDRRKETEHDFVFAQGDNEEAPGAPYTMQTLFASSVPITPSDITHDVQSVLGERIVSLKDYFKSRACVRTVPATAMTPYQLIKELPGAGLLECYLMRRGGFRFSVKSHSDSPTAVLFYYDSEKSIPVMAAHARLLLNTTSTTPTDLLPVPSRAFGIVIDPKDTVYTFETPHVGLTRCVRATAVGGTLFFATNSTSKPSLTIWSGLADETRFFHLLSSPLMVLAPYNTVDGKTVNPIGW